MEEKTEDRGEWLPAQVRAVRERMDAAARAAGRDPGEIVLLAATKYADADQITRLYTQCGVTDFGENRVQQLLEKWDRLPAGIRMHFIGTLQTNKVRHIVDKVCMIHSVDSVALAREIDKQAGKIGKRMDILVEINCAREPSKGGVLPEDAAAFCSEIVRFPHLCLRGFMTMAPKGTSEADYRKYFGETFALGLDIWHKTLHNIDGAVFSMGMSDSFEAAIAEGATLVRVGSALFRTPSEVAENGIYGKNQGTNINGGSV